MADLAAKCPELTYSPEVFGLWGESDVASTDKWRNDKIADFEAGGKTKDKYETMEKLEEWMTKTVYGAGGTVDKTLKLRGNPRVYFDMTADGEPLGRVIMQ